MLRGKQIQTQQMLDAKGVMLPQFPRTRHLPWQANAKRDDLIAAEAEAAIIFSSDRVSVEEKVDGSNAGMSILDGQPAIRNHNHIIHKAYSGRRTPAKLQFSSVWNWWYENRQLFEALDGPYTVYGEWCVAQHGMAYDHLPSWFIAHTVYDYHAGNWLDTEIARSLLTSAGFATTPLLHWGSVQSYQQLEALANGPSQFAPNSLREGVYIKVSDGRYITHNFKMVRPGFEQGALWSDSKMTKNKIHSE